MKQSLPTTHAWLSRLKRHLAWIISIKVLFILMLFYAFFSPAHRVDVQSTDAAQQLRTAPINTTASSAPLTTKRLGADADITANSSTNTNPEGE